MTEIESLSSWIVELYKHLEFFLSCSTPVCLYNSTMPTRPADKNFPVTIPSFVQRGLGGGKPANFSVPMGHYVMMSNETNNETLIKVPKPKLFQP